MLMPTAAAAFFPLHALRFLLRILCLYPIKVRVDGSGSIPAAGPALLTVPDGGIAVVGVSASRPGSPSLRVL